MTTLDSCTIIAGEMVSRLPLEIWLQILEQWTKNEIKHLWRSVRIVSRVLRDLVERHYRLNVLPQLNLSLSLPRRDAETGKLRWPGEPIPGLLLPYERTKSDSRTIIFRSPASFGKGSEYRTLKALKDAGVLPVARLRAAPIVLSIGRSILSSRKIHMGTNFEWDDDSGTWTLDFEWKKLVTQYCSSTR